MTDLDEIARRLNVTNSLDHPTDEMYKVFHFKMKEQADYFAELLQKNTIYFESDQDKIKGEARYLFGVHKKDIDTVTKLNYLAIGKYRKPLIANSGLKWFVVLFGLAALGFAIMSYYLKN